MPSCNTYRLTWVSLTLGVGYLLTAALPDLQCGIAPLGPPAPAKPRLPVTPLVAAPGLGHGLLLPAVAPGLRAIALISHTSQVMLKILQARLQQYVNRELPDVQAGFRKGRGTRDQIANIRWIMEKAREFQKNIYFCFLDYVKAFD